ncbi:uroporphyrinogen decarboxylase family protein [Marispirochaeta aestuarii]|uniref:uroporphyrinogen decarboxylase family protein n=1 Tax=Marispirochaeta aestuarii TaxID=1963862 RepID=UPI0029C9073F|nr:uroporphyrinogen decarboxylase family protein [Marispirochaeta aestuarii]
MDIKDYLSSCRPVVAPLLGYPGVHLNTSSIKGNVFDAAVQADTLLALDRRFGPDIRFTFMDLTAEAHAFGAPVLYGEMESPSMAAHILHARDDLEKLESRFSLEDERLQVYIDTVRRLRASGVQKPIAAYVSGPFTLAGLLMGANDIALNTLLDPELVSSAVECAAGAILSYAGALSGAGADIIVILEPTAVMLSPEMYWEFSGTWTEKLVGDLRCFSVLHICGNTEYLIPGMCRTGADALSLDSAVDLLSVASHIPKETGIIGNIDPVGVMCQKNPGEVRQRVLDLRRSMRDYDNFILSTGCDLPPETPLENISAFMEAGKAAL